MAEISDDQLQEAYQQYVAYRESEARYQRIELILAATVAVVLVVFVLASYLTVRSNFNSDGVGQSPQRGTFGPDPGNQHGTVGCRPGSAPGVRRSGRKEISKGLPDLERELSKELENLWDGIGTQVRGDFAVALDRAAKRLEKRLQAEFPGVLDGPGLAMLENELTELLEEDTADFLGQFFDRYASDLDKLYKTLEGFRHNRFERFDDDELSAYYIHLWLMLLDQEIMARD